MAAKMVVCKIEEVPIEEYRDELKYSGSTGDFDRLVADGYAPWEALDMIVDGEV